MDYTMSPNEQVGDWLLKLDRSFPKQSLLFISVLSFDLTKQCHFFT